MVNIPDIIDQAPKDIPGPPKAPEGTYLCLVESHEFGQSSQKKTPYVRYNFRALQEQEDVDSDALEAEGGLEKLTIRDEFYLTDGAIFRLGNFLSQSLGLPDDQTMRQLIPMADGQQVFVSIEHEPQEASPNNPNPPPRARVSGYAIVE